MGSEINDTKMRQTLNLEVYLATIFPLRHFVVMYNCAGAKMVLACKYCKRFEHLEGHSHTIELPAAAEQDIEKLYTSALNVELNGHLAYCLNCSDHHVRSWGGLFYQLLRHASSVRESDSNYKVISRCLYRRSIQRMNIGFLGWLTKQQSDSFDFFMEAAETHKQIVRFPFYY